MEYSFRLFGSTYTCGTYGAGTYENGTCSTSSTSGSGTTGSSSVLTNTGFDIVVAITLACVIIFSALVVRFWKRSRKAPPTEVT